MSVLTPQHDQPSSLAAPTNLLGLTMPRWAIWSVGGLALVAATLLSEQFMPSAPAPAASDKPVKPISLSPEKTEHEAWIATAQGELKAMAERVDHLTKQQELLQQALKEAGRGRAGGVGGPPPVGPAGPKLALRSANDGGLPAEPPPPMRPDAAAKPVAKDAGPPATGESAASPAPATPPAPAMGPPTTGPLVAPVQAGKPAPAAAGGQKLRVIEADRQAIPAKYWLPTGTIVPVRLLSGLDAPTGAGGGTSGMASHPHPVLMEVTDWAKLPNDTTMDAIGCFALGEGLGDISTERAMIRVLGFSCVKGDGVAVDLPVKGVVTGEDGKVGLRGRMVIRESAMLARTLLTGFVSGIA
jgi:conjugal transfer pilus assembly protein TraB